MKAYGEGRNLTPAIQKPLNRSSPKLVQVIMSGMPTNVQNFIQIGSGVSFLRMRDFAPLGAKLLGYLGGYLTMATAETRAPILTKSAFSGSQNQHLEPTATIKSRLHSSVCNSRRE